MLTKRAAIYCLADSPALPRVQIISKNLHPKSDRLLANIIVRASGYRVKSDGGGHYNTFLALKTADPIFAKKAGSIEDFALVLIHDGIKWLFAQMVI